MGFEGCKQSLVNCTVCSLVRRGDKIKDHQVHTVLFDDEGNPADDSHPRYKSLSQEEKLHTDFFRSNGYDRINLPRNKTVHNPTPGDIGSFVC